MWQLLTPEILHPHPVHDALSLHGLLLRIAVKGVEQLKHGWVCVYLGGVLDRRDLVGQKLDVLARLLHRWMRSCGCDGRRGQAACPFDHRSEEGDSEYGGGLLAWWKRERWRDVADAGTLAGWGQDMVAVAADLLDSACYCVTDAIPVPPSTVM